MLSDECHGTLTDSCILLFGSQVKILEQCVNTIPHSNPEAKAYYNSNEFNKLRLFINNTTHVENVKHLYANHYIDINKKEIKRFYPNQPNYKITIAEAVVKVATMLKGYLKAISNENSIQTLNTCRGILEIDNKLFVNVGNGKGRHIIDLSSNVLEQIPHQEEGANFSFPKAIFKENEEWIWFTATKTVRYNIHTKEEI